MVKRPRTVQKPTEMEREAILKLFEYLESFLLRNIKEVCFLFQGDFEEKRLAVNHRTI
jgi:adenine specific DNA methylase Mod